MPLISNKTIIALHFVPMGAHLVYMGAECIPNGRPWTQNVGYAIHINDILLWMFEVVDGLVGPD